MAFTKVTKIFTFESAHQLINHNGQCAYLHGHSYKLEVTLGGQPILTKGHPKQGFVMDFGDLKEIVKELVVDKFDHAFIAEGGEEYLEVLKESGSKVVELGFRATAENMSKYIVHELIKAEVPVYSVRLWETSTGYAEVTKEAVLDELEFYGKLVYSVCGCGEENCEH